MPRCGFVPLRFLDPLDVKPHDERQPARVRGFADHPLAHGVAVAVVCVMLAFGLVVASLAPWCRTTPKPPPIAKHPIEVVQTTVSNFVTIGGFGFAFTAFNEATKRSGVSGKAKAAVPRFVFQAALEQGTKWGKVSAGFAGGRAAGQVWRGEDDFHAAMCGAVAAGVMASETIGGIPGSVATFVMFSYFIEKLTANMAGAARGACRRRRSHAPRRQQHSQRSVRPSTTARARPAQVSRPASGWTSCWGSLRSGATALSGSRHRRPWRVRAA